MDDRTFPRLIRREDLAVLAGSIAVLWLVMQLHLITAMLAGLLIYELVHVLAGKLRIASLVRAPAKVVALVLLSLVVIALLVGMVFAIMSAVRNGNDSLPAMMQKLAEIIDGSRQNLPTWIADSLPATAADLQNELVDIARRNGDLLQLAGKHLSSGLVHILLGLVVGALLALREVQPVSSRGPFSVIVADRAGCLAESFRKVVFAQVWISTINTALTSIYLLGLLPLFGVHLPQVKTLIVITWVVGLLPILGNLLSNSLIVAFSFSHSAIVAGVSLLFLIVVHKLEYFLNAKIIGSKVNAAAWELLLSMLVMEAAFGTAGVIAAPIFYTFLKGQFVRLGLVGPGPGTATPV